MQSRWDLNGGDDRISVTTDRGSSESNEAFLTRHEAAVDEALSGAVTDAGEREGLIEAMGDELADDLVSLGSDAVSYEITLPE